MLLSAAVLCQSQDDFIEINNINDFVAWRNEAFASGSGTVTANIRLMGDLVFNETTSSNVPLGGQHGTMFSGVFDGNGNTIRGLTVSTTGGAGMFWFIADATIKNLVIDESCSFVDKSTAGGLCGVASGNVVIDNVTNHASVTGGIHAGGVVGQVMGNSIFTVTNCVNTGSIAATSTTESTRVYSGGIVGYIIGGTETTLENVSNVGGVSSTSKEKAYTGGIVGITEVERCHK